MYNSEARGSGTSVIIIILALLVVIGGAIYFGNLTPTPEMEMEEEDIEVVEEETTTISSLMVTLDELKKSGQKGVAKFASVGEGTQVTINLTGFTDPEAQPAHVHLGSCEKLGAIAYPLSNVELDSKDDDTGISKTLIAVSIDQLLIELPLAVNVHASVDHIDTNFVCGDIIHPDDAMDGAIEANAESNDTENEMASAATSLTGSLVEFDVEGRNFAFSTDEIRVKKGDRVKINFKSSGGFHDWVVDEFNAATERVTTDGEDSVEFIADTAGTFEYYCSVGNHRALGMIGNLIVE